MARNQQQAFTMNELIVVLAVVGIVGILPALARPRVNSSTINCANNLKNIGLAVRIFATDNGGKFPMQVSTNEGGVKELVHSGANVYRIFQSLSNELSSTILTHCRADIRSRAFNFSSMQNSNISYFIGGDATEMHPAAILAGDRNIRANIPAGTNKFFSLRTNQFIGWTKEIHTAEVKKRAFFGQVEYTLADQSESAGNIVLADGSVRLVNDQALLQAHRKTGLATNRFMLPD